MCSSPVPRAGWLPRGGLSCSLLLLLTGGAVQADPRPLPAADGRTRWIRSSVVPGAAWEGRFTPADSGWVFLELEGASEGGPDLDLVVRRGRVERGARSHLASERLLVEATGGAPLDVVVERAGGEGGPGRFRLGVTWLAGAPALAAGSRTAGGLAQEEARARLVPLEPGQRPLTCRLRLDGGGEGDVDLVVLDDALDAVELGVGDEPREECLVDLQPGRPTWALLLARRGDPTWTLHLDRPGKGIKSFRRSDLDRFLDELATTPEQGRALGALRRHPDFLRIRHYLERYPGGQPLALRVVPGLRARGAERFGTYSRGTLTINPTIEGHRENVQELVDTLVHELVHALLDLPRGPHYPLAPDVTDAAHDPRLGSLAGRPLVRGRVPEPYRSYLESCYGPSASDPARDYTDVNDAAQRLIAKVVRANMRRTGLGRETLVFENLRARDRVEAR